LKDTVVSGSLRTTDTLYSTIAQFQILRAPTTSGGTTFGPGTANNLLKSNGTSVYWTTLAASDIPSLNASKINAGTFDVARIPTLSITDKTSGTLTVGRGGTGATDAAGARTNLGLGSIAVKADTDYVKFLGNLTSLGSGTPASSAQTYWIDNINTNSVNIAYNTSGNEYSLIFSKGGSNSVGSILRWGYPSTYLYILRKTSSSWTTTDWEKISAGYADSSGTCSGNAATATKLSNTPTSSTTSYFLRGDNTWTNALANNFIPNSTRSYNLGDSSHYWSGAYIYGNGYIHPAALSGVCGVGGTTFVTSDSWKGPVWWLYRDLGDRGSRNWNMSAKNILIEYTTNSGSNWAEKTGMDAESKRGITTSGNANYGSIGNVLMYNAGTTTNNGTTVYTTHPQRVAGNGVRITLSSAAANGSAHYGWWSILILNIAGYMGTYTVKTESAYYNSSGTEVWNTIDDTRTFCNNSNWDSTLYIYPETTYYWDGANNRTTGNNKRYMHKLRVTLICTAVKTADTTQSANRYSGWINRILCVGGASGSDVTANNTYPDSSRYQWSMGRFDEPYYITDARLGRVQFSTDEVYIRDDLLKTPANIDRWATLILGTSSKKTELNNHAQGRILIYSNLNGYHYIQDATDNTSGYTSYLGKATGWLAVGANSG